MTEKMIPKTLVTVINKRFFYLADVTPPKEFPNAFFFNIDNDLYYEGFFEDFGPLNLSKIWKYIHQVYKFLNDQKYANCTFYHYTSPHYTKCTNSALLACSYMVIVMKKTPQEAFQPFRNVPFRPFRDAGYGQCSYNCTILDCLRGLHYAVRLGWFDYKKFDITQYEHYEKIQNGDINWMIPGKFVAFSSPYDKPKDDSGNILFTPKDYIPIFKKIEINAVVRLNNQTYDSSLFKERGIKHHQLYFADEIVHKFLQIAEKQPGALAVHCKAGLGRTGTLIACYAIKHYHFCAGDLIGWLRLCRPGSILGPQQFFLHQFEMYLKQEGKYSPIWKEVREKFSEAELTAQMKQMTINSKGKMNKEQMIISQQGQYGQGNKLVDAKKKLLEKKK